MPNIPTETCDATTLTRDQKQYISFGGCNYLGLAHDPRVIRAVQSAADQYGLSSSASRETTGNTLPHAQLERLITEHCQHRAGLLVPDGYTANLAACQGLEQMGIGHAVVDERAHASLKDAARLAGMHIHLYRHQNATHAREILDQLQAPAVVLTDSVFTTDGALAPAKDLLGSLRLHDWLLLDDCHGFGVLGAQGRGTPEYLGLNSNRLIVTTTLAKGLGCHGGIVMGDPEAIESARDHSIAYRCTTPASPALIAGGIEALRIVRDDEQLRASLKRNVDLIRGVLRSNDIPAHDHETAIFAFTIGDTKMMRALEHELQELGVILPLMAYPNGPAPEYFRLAVNARHRPDQIEHFSTSLHNALQRIQRTGLVV